MMGVQVAAWPPAGPGLGPRLGGQHSLPLSQAVSSSSCPTPTVPGRAVLRVTRASPRPARAPAVNLCANSFD
eukprot:795589-Rhodomonas_salina.2